MANVLIIGAGLAGVPCAYELRRQLAPEHHLTVIAASPRFDFIPSNSWLALGWRERPEIQVDLREPMARRGISLITQPAVGIDPAAHHVTLKDGQCVGYDHLVIAAGPSCAFSDIPGLGPTSVGGHTQALSTLAQALEAREAWHRFLLNPGPIVVASVNGHPPAVTHEWRSHCLADYGGQGEVLNALKNTSNAANTPKPVDGSRWLQLTKIAYEKYFLDQVRSGMAAPPYHPNARNLLTNRPVGVAANGTHR